MIIQIIHILQCNLKTPQIYLETLWMAVQRGRELLGY